MPSSQSWSSAGANTSTSKPFPSPISGDTSVYYVKTEANVDNNIKISQSKLTLQDEIEQGNTKIKRDLATSFDGGKTWVPTKDSEGKSILSSTQIAALYQGNKLNKTISEQARKDAKSKGASDSLADQLTGKPQPTPPESGNQPSSTPDPITTKDLDIEKIKGEKFREWNNVTYYYPTSIQTNGQDFIKFNIIQYQTSKIDKKNSTSFEKKYTTVDSLANIILPIQPSITDRNLVEWGQNELNPVQLAGYSLASEGTSGELENITKILNTLGDTVSKDPNVKKAITLYLKQKTLNVSGLLSRFGGAIVNPNLELIFQGPQLRPFDFTFRLSPRDIDEATQVRSIIRAFKEAMAPQVSAGGLFLATPNVFNISYHTKGKNNEETLHPSLNKIKTCALQSCNVDYTPDGSYMTFNDEKRTMTSYNLTLQFVELEPVTSKDYTTPYDEIGY